MKDIYEYLDYRKYLSDFFAEQRTKTPFFSFRYVEKRVGVDASNLSKIIQGKRHITDGAFKNFVLLLKLDVHQEEFFRLLVLFSRSRSASKSRDYFEQIMGFNSVMAQQVSLDRFEYYRHWYYSAILALLYYFPVKKNEYELMAAQLEPPILASQAQEAVELLLRLKFITINSDKQFEHTDDIITSGEQWKSIAVESFQKQTLELALRSLTEMGRNERHISTLTVTLSEDSYSRIRDITAEYRKAVLKAVAESDTTDQVYQINLQLFPLSKKRSDNE